MPKIPGLEGQQVELQAYKPVTRTDRYSPDDFGASALAKGAKDMAAGLQQYANKAKRDADSTAVLEADRKLGEWENRNLYDAKDGAYQVLGKDSMALPERLMPDLDKTIAEIEAGLTGDEQKNTFRRLSGTRRLDVDRGLQNHISKQISIYQEQASSAYVDNAVEAAAANYDDPERIATEVSRIELAFTSRAQVTGEAPEVTQKLITDKTSDAHVGVVNRMLSEGRYSWAREYLKANKDDISATKIDEVEKAVRTGAVREEAQDHADTIMGSAKDRAKALAEARKIKDPDVQEETVQQVNQRWNEINQAQEEGDRNRLRDATLLITNGGKPEDISPAEWIKIPEEQRIKLKALSNEGEWYQDDKKWEEFIDTYSADPAKVAKINLYTELRPYTDRAHFDRAVEMKEAALKALKGDSTDYTHTLNFQQRLKNSLVENKVFETDLLGDSESGLGDDEKARYAKIESEASMRLAEFEHQKQAKATPQEIERIVDKVVMDKVFLNKSWQRDPEKLSVEVLQDEAGKAYVPVKSIPPVEIETLKNLAASKGRAYNDDKAQRAYAATIMGNAAAVHAIMAE